MKKYLILTALLSSSVFAGGAQAATMGDTDVVANLLNEAAESQAQARFQQWAFDLHGYPLPVVTEVWGSAQDALNDYFSWAAFMSGVPESASTLPPIGLGNSDSYSQVECKIKASLIGNSCRIGAEADYKAEMNACVQSVEEHNRTVASSYSYGSGGSGLSFKSVEVECAQYIYQLENDVDACEIAEQNERDEGSCNN